MKIALVTGAYKGLGLEWCKRLGKKGYAVILTARRLDKAAAAAKELGNEGFTVVPKAVDVASEEEIVNLAAEVQREFGHLDLLVNNAGINSKDHPDESIVRKSTFLAELDRDEVLKHISINSVSPILMVKYFRELLKQAEKPIVVSVSSWLGSIAAKDSMRGHYSYCTSKAALNMMNRAMSIELKEEGIISIVVNPGWVRTDMGGETADLTAEQSVNGLVENVIEKVTIGDTGRFYQWDGSIHPW